MSDLNNVMLRLSQRGYSAEEIETFPDEIERLNERVKGLEDEYIPVRVEGGRWWSCLIGPAPSDKFTGDPPLDPPMRGAVEDAFIHTFGKQADVCFSGWSDAPSALERRAIKKPEVEDG